MESIVSSNIRINEISWEKLKEVAKYNKRSLNKEIEFIIDKEISEYEKEHGEIELEEL